MVFLFSTKINRNKSINFDYFVEINGAKKFNRYQPYYICFGEHILSLFFPLEVAPLLVSGAVYSVPCLDIIVTSFLGISTSITSNDLGF